jgi:hypothetical protein
MFDNHALVSHVLHIMLLLRRFPPLSRRPLLGGEGGAGANQVVLRLKNKRTHVKLSNATTGEGEGGTGANQVVIRLKNKRAHVKLSNATTQERVRAGQEPFRWFSD